MPDCHPLIKLLGAVVMSGAVCIVIALGIAPLYEALTNPWEDDDA